MTKLTLGELQRALIPLVRAGRKTESKAWSQILKNPSSKRSKELLEILIN